VFSFGMCGENLLDDPVKNGAAGEVMKVKMRKMAFF